MILAVDAGNSRIKWGVHVGGDWLRQGAVPTGENLQYARHRHEAHA